MEQDMSEQQPEGPAPAAAAASTGEATAWDAPAVQAAGVTPETPQPVTGPGPAAEDAGPPVTGDEQLGMQALAAGGAATSVDSDQLLAEIRALQGRVTAMEAEKRASVAPEVVKIATAVGDHLQAKASASPVIHADPDYTWHPVLEQAKALADTATQAADVPGVASSGHVERIADDIATWVRRHARQFTGLDYSYIEQLLEDVKDANKRLAA